MHILSRTPGARPAVVGGLINGVAIATPLLIGAVSGEPAAGATACIGAYIAAFTNKGGERWSRTTGLTAAAIVNACAFAVGAVTTRLFPIDVMVFAILVFIASMGAVFGSTAARCGTMPATAFLAGIYMTDQASVAVSVFLVAVGGLWYAVATLVLTPAPRLRRLVATIGAAYSEVASSMADETSAPPANRTAIEAALREADDAVLVLAGPGGDDAIAQPARTLVDTAAALVDSIAGLRSTSEPDPAIAREYRALGKSLAMRLDTIAGELTRGKPGTASTSDDAIDSFIDACNRVRQAAIDGEVNYPRASAVAQLRRRMIAVSAAVDSAGAQAARLAGRPNVRLPGSGGPPATRFTLQGLRDAMRLTSTTYRHALRTTAITSLLFAVVEIAHLPHGEWAALAALRVLRPQYGATTQRAWQRVVGNIVGGTCAAVAIAGIHSATALAALLFVIIAVGFALRPVNYAFWVLFGTPLILLIGDITDQGDWRTAVGRITMTIVEPRRPSSATSCFCPTGRPTGCPASSPGQRPRRPTTSTRCWRMSPSPVPRIAPPWTPRGAPPQRGCAVRMKACRGAQRTRAHWNTRRRNGSQRVVRCCTSLGRLDIIAHPEVVADSASGRIPPTRCRRCPSLPRAVGRHRRRRCGRTAVDGMRQYIHDLHARRETEMREQPDAETPLRASVRENEPVVEELARIAETIASLTNTVAPRSMS
jgi:uncharacterized membrane protein YgaE (UPF0421/DUF939 family)